VVVLPLVRIWVHREDALSSVGEGERRLWGSSGAEETVEREGRNVGWKRKQMSKLIFGNFWTPFSPCSGHEMHPYLKEVEEGYFFFNGAKLWPLVWSESIPTVGTKCAS
jgi:hypothetical protein